MTARPTRPQKKSDGEDNLSAYFRDLTNFDLLTPEEERELAKQLEEAEVAVWEAILARTDALDRVLAIVRTAIDSEEGPPIAFLKLVREAKGDSKKKLGKTLPELVKDAALAMRAYDIDKVVADKIARELPDEAVNDARRAALGLRDDFLRANLRLVVTMARRYDRGAMPLSDLIQEGNLGLMHALSRFDYRRGLRFSTYACWWIRHAIGRGVADKARTVRVPVHTLEAHQTIEKIRQRLIGELGRPPTAQELEEEAVKKMTADKFDMASRAGPSLPVSLDSSVHEDGDMNVVDVVGDLEMPSPDDQLTDHVQLEQLRAVMSCLSPIEADVIAVRFGLDGNPEDLTFKAIGRKYDLSRERMRQICNTAIDKIRRAMYAEHPESFFAKPAPLPEEDEENEENPPPLVLEMSDAKRKVGWPKGRPRGPRKPRLVNKP